MGKDYGLTAVEMNFLLKEEGFLDGRPGMYTLTEKGKQYADEQHHRRGTGGYAWYNREFDTTTWDPSITDEFDITNERKQQLQEAARAARQQKADLRRAQAAEFESANVDYAEPNASGPDPLAVAVGLALAAVSIYGIKKVAPHLKTLWTDKAAPSLKKLKNPTAGDTTTHADTPDSDDDPST
jgi:hypothetical protein